MDDPTKTRTSGEKPSTAPTRKTRASKKSSRFKKVAKKAKTVGKKTKKKTSSAPLKQARPQGATISGSWDKLVSYTRLPPNAAIVANPAKPEHPKPHEGLVYAYQWHTSRVRRFAASKRARQQLAVLKEGRLTLYHIKAAKGREANQVSCVQEILPDCVVIKTKTQKIGLKTNAVILRVADRADFEEWCTMLDKHKVWRASLDVNGERVDSALVSEMATSSSVKIQMDQALAISDLWTGLDLDIREARKLVRKTEKELKEHEDSRALLKKVAAVMNNNRVKSALVHFQQTLDDANRAHDTMNSALEKIILLRKELKAKQKTLMSMGGVAEVEEEDASATQRDDDSDFIGFTDDEITQVSDHGDVVPPITSTTPSPSLLPTPPPTPPPPALSQAPPPARPAPPTPKIERRRSLPGRAPPMPFGMSMFVKAARSGTLPIEMFQPITTLQLFAEDLAYSSLLDKACVEVDAVERMTLVAVFAISAYGNSAHRTRKPFNPLLGETFEWDRWADLGWRYHAEQIDHGPDTTACAAVGKAGWRWSLCAEIPRPSTSLWSTTLDISWKSPLNGCRLLINGDEYRWNKVITSLVYPTSAERYIRHYGEMVVTCTNGTRAVINFPTPKTNSVDLDPRAIHGRVFSADDTKNAAITLSGSWSGDVDGHRRSTDSSRCVFSPSRITSMTHRQDMFAMSDMAVQANEETLAMLERPPAGTDSRYRPDQQCVENGEFEKAAKLKASMEATMRDRRTAREKNKEVWTPLWFKPSYVANDAKKSTKKEVQWWQTKDTYWSKKATKFADVSIPQLF